MALVLNEEQRLLKDTAKDFLSSTMPVSELRALRDSGDTHGYKPDHWQAMCELGWSGIVFPEEFGGLDFGYLGLGAIFEQTGRTLAASPLLSTVVLSASLIQLAASEQQKQELLPAIISGELTLALALEEGHHHAPTAIQTQAEKTADGYILNGRKSVVLDASSADKLVVIARTNKDSNGSEGLSAFLVNSQVKGITQHSKQWVDSRSASEIIFENVQLSDADLLGEADQIWPALNIALDRSRICLAAEMLGGALECFERTVAYLKERDQFGQKIGSFQALQHRAAILFTELELAKSVVLDALSAIDDKRPDLPQLASLAKARLNDVFEKVTSEAVQMHGGIGVTDELEIGFFLKRSRVATQLFGNSGFHRDRYATLCGY
ncbi:acyl-CoA/acyl-ACP dehydrogenase [Spongiibacter sp. KMU-158]|uniref:Acyl-CoA/acyl-ACP dehydrogenase n=1 Tax=Spongiibacter pelagi TaxID=2760804 RepID=A0A927GW42_9GAMM|nr:acyl-CoA dehydrogenase family protein [Spongiibacter pelagi]MBD2858557.1 acyl-CoA/acyl-ACP dehydrogenase [Spongiibacter pelagi]